MLIRFLKYRNEYHSNNFYNFFFRGSGTFYFFFLSFWCCVCLLYKEIKVLNYRPQTNIKQTIKNKDWPLLGPRQQLKYFEHKKYDELLAPNFQYLTRSIWPQLSIAIFVKYLDTIFISLEFLCKSFRKKVMSCL